VNRSDTGIDTAALRGFLASLGYAAGLLGVEKLAGDGSTRSYHRLKLEPPELEPSELAPSEREAESLVLMVGPDAAENGGFLRIAAHLARCGICVPEVLGHSGEQGWILLEDLGDVNLLDCVLKAQSDGERVELLTPVVELLARMGVEGAAGFSLETGFSPSHYDAALMVKEEGRYFLEEFVCGVLEVGFDRTEVEAELEGLAHRVEAELAGGCSGVKQGEFFLHRDFQSRNVMRTDGKWVVIDFQGGRPGPLAYDVAAFIFDPYMANSLEVREALVHRYRECISSHPDADVDVFDRTLGPVGAFRIMQALGAYGKLGHRFKKPGFLEHSGAALEHLEWFFLRCTLLAPQVETKALLELTRLCRQKWNERAPGHCRP
jgi:hypothetical protein